MTRTPTSAPPEGRIPGARHSQRGDTVLRHLSLDAVLATLLLITVGGIVRATGSGLGCPDWPRCHGRLVPPGEYHSLIEFSHRAVAGVTGILVVLLAVAALVVRPRGRVRLAACAAVALIAWQAYLGRLVVLGELKSSSVAIHLFTALALLALLLYLAHAVRRPDAGGTPPPPAAHRARVWVVVTGIASLVALVTGAYVTGTGAAWSVSDWPLVRGAVFPPHDLNGVLVYVHRLLAGLAAVAAVVTWRIGRASGDRDVERLTAGAALLYGLQVLFGAGNALLGMPAPFVVLHVATGSLIWATYVWAFLVSAPGPLPPPPSTEDAPRPVLPGCDPAPQPRSTSQTPT